MKRTLYILMVMLGFGQLQGATTIRINQGSIIGTVMDTEGTPIPFANISIEQEGQTVTGGTTDFDGIYKIKGLAPGSYSVKASSVGFSPEMKTGVVVVSEQISVVDFALKAGVKLEQVVIVDYKHPLIRQDGGSGMTFSSNGFGGGAARGGISLPTHSREVKQMACRGVAGVATMVGGVQQDHNGAIGSIRGNRNDGSESFIYVDGVKVWNSTAVTSEFVTIEPRAARSVPNRQRTKRGSKKNKLRGLPAGHDLYAQQSFKNTFAEPLSTFSIDVDAASYSQIRRSLNMGSLPPKHLVRIEEMINYFSYDYTQPETETPFSINTEVGECTWNSKHKLVHVGLQGREMKMEKRPENNLVFLIDVSGSMSNQDKLPLLKKSLRLLVDQLEESDRISIVVYAGAAGLVLPSTKGDEKGEILNAISRLSSGGSTAGGAGINLAYRMAEKHFIKEGNNRVILCTDGDFNVGVSDKDGLEGLIEKKRETGVFLTVLGFGTGNFQDAKMETLADKGNGNFAYIDNLQEAQKVLVQEFWGTLFTIAKDVKIQIEFNPANVLAYRLIGYENRRLAAEDFNDDRKDAGELGAGHTVTALYEVIPTGGEIPALSDVDSLKYQITPPKLAGSHADELLTVKLRYKEPDGEVSKLLKQTVGKDAKALLECSDNLRFSAAVAQFGMILLDEKLDAGQRMGQIKEVVTLADGAKGEDEKGHKAEFIRLAELAIASD